MKSAVECLWITLFEIKKNVPFNEQTEAILKAYHEAKELEKEQFERLKDFDTWKEWKDTEL